MKGTLRNSLIGLFTFSSAALAGNGAEVGQGGFLLTLFVGFFAMILVFQIVPAILFFVGTVKGLVVQDTSSVTDKNS